MRRSSRSPRDTYPDIRFNPDDYSFNVHRLLLETAVRLSNGRYLVGMPDLIENIDILSQMRDGQKLMTDMIERPGWVEKCARQINQVYFDAFDRLYNIIRKGLYIMTYARTESDARRIADLVDKYR